MFIRYFGLPLPYLKKKKKGNSPFGSPLCQGDCGGNKISWFWNIYRCTFKTPDSKTPFSKAQSQH